MVSIRVAVRRCEIRRSVEARCAAPPRETVRFGSKSSLTRQLTLTDTGRHFFLRTSVFFFKNSLKLIVIVIQIQANAYARGTYGLEVVLNSFKK